MISTQVQLESADLDYYKECETGIRGNAFTMDRAFKETTFNVVELVTVGVKTGTTLNMLILCLLSSVM